MNLGTQTQNLRDFVLCNLQHTLAVPVLVAILEDDLDRLEAAHAAEEACDAARNVIDAPRPEGPHKPAPRGAIRLPQSTALVERFGLRSALFVVGTQGWIQWFRALATS